VTGLLVPDHDPAALAEALGRLVGDEDLRWRLGREGVRWAAQHRWPCVAEAVCREYAALVEAAAPHLAAGRCQEPVLHGGHDLAPIPPHVRPAPA